MSTVHQVYFVNFIYMGGKVYTGAELVLLAELCKKQDPGMFMLF